MAPRGVTWFGQPLSSPTVSQAELNHKENFSLTPVDSGYLVCRVPAKTLLLSLGRKSAGTE